MKKFLFVTILFVCGFAVESKAQVGSHIDAVRQAQEICEMSGQNQKAATNNNYTGSINYGVTSTYESTHKDGQNNWNAGGELGGKADVKAVEVNAGFTGGYNYVGEQDSNKSSTTNTNTGTYYFICEDE